MSSHHLEYLLAPQSLAVIGASDRPGSVGAMVMANVLSGGFRGPVWPVNLRHPVVAGLRACATAADAIERTAAQEIKSRVIASHSGMKVAGDIVGRACGLWQGHR